MARISKKVNDRLSSGLKRFQPILKAAKSRDINESDTAVIIADMLEDVFGFDKYSEVTSEFEIRSTYCDLAIKLDGQLKLLIEVKAIGVTLQTDHVKQAVDYAANMGLDWVVLTNGLSWKFFRIKYGKPIDKVMVVEFDVGELSPRSEDAIEQLYLLSREGWMKSAIADYYQQHKAFNSYTVAAVLQSEGVAKLVKKELRSMFRGVKVDLAKLQELIKESVIKREVAEADETKKVSSRLKRRTRSKKSSPSKTADQ